MSSRANSTLINVSIHEGSASLKFESSSCGYNGDDIPNFDGSTIVISSLSCLCTFQKCLILN